MRSAFFFVLVLSSMVVSAQDKMNVLLICVDDLRPELASFGAEYIHSPNIDQLVREGRAFQRHYVNAPSCGPSRYTLLTGRYGTPNNNALFLRADRMKEKPGSVSLSMPEWFRNNGYKTVSLGKVSHHPGGLGGPDWNDESQVEMPGAWDHADLPVAGWEHPRGVMHGLANGETRSKVKGTMDVFQSTDGGDKLYPDGHITAEALSWLDRLNQTDEPFFFAVGLIRPHLPFGAPKQYLDLYDEAQIPEITNTEKPTGVSTWHQSGEFMQYNLWGKDPRVDPAFAQDVRRHYAACVSYADAQVGKIMSKLKANGQDKNTIVVLWGDHGWNLGEHNIWGKHNLFETALRSPLIIKLPTMKHPGKSTNAIVQTADVFPTLCDLTNLPSPEFTNGNSLLKLIRNPKRKGHLAYAYRSNISTIRDDRYRLILHEDGVELYDHVTDAKEINNLAGRLPKIVNKLKRKLMRQKDIHLQLK